MSKSVSDNDSEGGGEENNKVSDNDLEMVGEQSGTTDSTGDASGGTEASDRKTKITFNEEPERFVQQRKNRGDPIDLYHGDPPPHLTLYHSLGHMTGGIYHVVSPFSNFVYLFTDLSLLLLPILTTHECVPTVGCGLRTPQRTGTRDSVHTVRDLHEICSCRYHRSFMLMY